MGRWIAPAFAALLATLAFGQDRSLSKKIDFDEPAARLDVVLNDLSKVAGTQFSASPIMAREIVVVDAHQVSVFDLAKRIAAVTAGQWDKQDETYVLEPDNAVRAKQIQAYSDEKLAETKKSIDTIKKRVTGEQDKAKVDDSPESDASAFGFGQNKMIDKLLLQIDPSTIADLDAHQRVVFASSPTPMQLQLPSVDPDDITALIKQQDKNAQAAQSAQQSIESEEPGIAEAIQPVFDQYFKPISGTPAEALLIVSNTGGLFNAKVADLRLYDSKGNVLYTGREQLGDPFGGLIQMGLNSQGEASDQTSKPAARLTGKGVPIPFTAKDKLFLQMQGVSIGVGTAAQLPKVSSDLMKIMLDPAGNEPLNLGNSTAMKAVAEERSEQLVGDLPDSLLGGFVSGGDRNLKIGMTTAQYRALLDKNGTVDMAEGGGWMEVSPKEPAKNREERFDRVSLTALIQNAQKRGAPSLDDLAAYALVSNEPMLDSPVALYFMFGVPGAMNRIMMGGSDWQTLRFYGALSPSQKDGLRSGQALSLQTMTPDQVEYLREMAFGNYAKLTVAGTEPKGGETYLSKIMAVGMESFMPTAQKTYLEEPTECMPQGLPSGLGVSESTEISSAVKMADNTSAYATMFGDLGPEEYGSYEAVTGTMKVPNMPALNKLLVGRRATYHMRIQLLRNVYMERDLIDDSFPSDGTPVGPDDLPEDFKEKADKAAADLRKLIPTGGLPVAHP